MLFNGEAKFRAESAPAQDAKMVFLESIVRVADCSDDPVFYISQPVVGITKTPFGMVGDCIDGEVAASEILLDCFS